MINQKTLNKWVASLPKKEQEAIQKLSRDWIIWFYSMRKVPDDGREPLDNMPSNEEPSDRREDWRSTNPEEDYPPSIPDDED